MSPESSHRVLLAGCGELGTRHLQAVAQIPSVGSIDVVDPRPEGLALGRKRLAEIPNAACKRVQWLSKLAEAPPTGGLCIVATQAAARGEIFRRAAALGYKNFLLEKIVTPSVHEYETLLDLAKTLGLGVWVNCKSRAYPSHRRIRQHLVAGEPVTLAVTGGNHGLANNGVHFADLFAFFAGGGEIALTGADIDPVLHRSKRGERIFDLSGRMHGRSNNGSAFTMVFDAGHEAPPIISIVSPRYRAVVDDMVKLFYESSADSGWAWRQVPYDANLMVSHMTRTFAAEILDSGSCELPTLAECFPAHRFILESLRPHFNRLLGVETEACPVT